MNNLLEEEKYYPLEEAAKFLNVTGQTVSKYLRGGILKGKKMGPKQKWHVPGEEILRKRKEWGYN